MPIKAAPDPRDQKSNPGDISALAYATNIDRRKCTRTVPMRVLCLGIGRTGTASLRQALIDLGYKDCYHYTTLLQENPRDMSMWIDALEAKFSGLGPAFTRREWDQLLGHCQAVTDAPCILFWRELLAAYPDAKVILTVRDSPEQWFASQKATLMPFIVDIIAPARTLWGKICRSFLPLDGLTVRFNDTMFCYDPMFRTLWADHLNGSTTAMDWYKEHNAAVVEAVPEDRLLVMNVKEGWEPLCRHLGEDVPLYPFPRKNDTVTFQRNVDGFMHVLWSGARWSMVRNFGVVAVAVGAVLAGSYRYNLFGGPR